MKALQICAALLFSLFVINFSSAQSTVKKETIKVWGNCGMCKTNIEKAAKSAGASYANWNEDSKQLRITYAVNKTSTARIQEAIAKSGYDTQDLTADQGAYDKLHACCKYDRKSATPATAKMKCCDNEKCGTTADCCKGMSCCKDKASCGTQPTAMKCGTTGNCDKNNTCCKSK
jgi:hypothetical protein